MVISHWELGNKRILLCTSLEARNWYGTLFPSFPSAKEKGGRKITSRRGSMTNTHGRILVKASYETWPFHLETHISQHL